MENKSFFQYSKFNILDQALEVLKEINLSDEIINDVWVLIKNTLV